MRSTQHETSWGKLGRAGSSPAQTQADRHGGKYDELNALLGSGPSKGGASESDSMPSAFTLESSSSLMESSMSFPSSEPVSGAGLKISKSVEKVRWNLSCTRFRERSLLNVVIIFQELDKLLAKASDNKRIIDDRNILVRQPIFALHKSVSKRFITEHQLAETSVGSQAQKAADLLVAADGDIGAAAQGLVSAIAKKAEIDECFQPKVRSPKRIDQKILPRTRFFTDGLLLKSQDKQRGKFTNERLAECLRALDKAALHAQEKERKAREKDGEQPLFQFKHAGHGHGFVLHDSLVDLCLPH